MSLVSEIKKMIKHDKQEKAKHLRIERRMDYETIEETYPSDVYYNRIYVLEHVLKLIK